MVPIRATTGGGALLQLNPQTGQIIKRFGEGITQALAIQPGTGRIFVSSGKGIEVFDPQSETFTNFSDIRVDNLAVVRLLSITSNEPTNGSGDGNTGSDIEICPD